MGKTKKRLQAQRKFAQGAYVPPINNTSTTSAPIMNASHKAVNAPGPVIINHNSARDIFTQMTMGRAHPHIDWPVKLKYDSGLSSKPLEINTRKKLKDKKPTRVGNLKKKYVLRNNQKVAAYPRRLSVTDSESDTPLSSLSTKIVKEKLEDTESPPFSGETHRQRRNIPSYSDPNFSYKSPDTSAVPGCSLHDGATEKDNLVHSSIALSDFATKSHLKKAKKRKTLNKNKANLKLIKAKLPKYVETAFSDVQVKSPAPLKIEEVDAVCTTFSPNMQGFTVVSPKISPSLLDDRIEESDCMPPDVPYEKTAEWVRTHHQSGVYSTAVDESNATIAQTSEKVLEDTSLSTLHSNDIPVTICTQNDDASSLTVLGRRLTALESYMSLAPNKGESTVTAPGSSSPSLSISDPDAQVSDNYFKIPDLPVRFTKRNKSMNSCPTRLFDTLHTLLNGQSAENESSYCNICKRCELLSKYRKVIKLLPVSDANEPDILDMKPNDVYNFDSDEGGLKFLRRGRELVRNVLTTKRFPIWLSNLEMNLKKTMFQDEHKLGTLKRTLVFDKDDVLDEMVNKVITRVDYLARCIAEDKKELDKESSRRRLRSAKVSPLGGQKKISRSKKLAPRRKQASTGAHAKPARPKPPAALDPERDTPTGTFLNSRDVEPRRMVLCLTPVEKIIKQCGLVQTLNALPLDEKKLIPDKLKISQTSHTPKVGQTSVSQQKVKENTTKVRKSSMDQTCGASKGADTDEEPIHFDFPFNNDFHRASSSLRRNTQNVPPSIQSSEALLVFRPTPEEFKDPMGYIEKIKENARIYGICKIIPPKGFDVPSHLDDSVKFTTISQYLGRLYHRWGPTSREMAIIQTYVAMLANTRERDQFTKAPLFDGVELDLVKLYHVVVEEGGIEKMLADSENWTVVAEKMGFATSRSKPDYKKLEKLYCKHVLPYESLSHHDRQKIQGKVDKVWAERAKSMMRRVQRPLHYQQRVLGETNSDDEDELCVDPDIEDVRIAGKQCFDRIEECTGKGRPMNLATYRRIAAYLKEMRFPNGPEPTTLQIEDEYWSIVTLGKEHTGVLSAFIDTSVKNLGHPSNPNEPGGSHPWNLKRLTENPDNILSSLGKSLSVTVPTLCLNQLFSTNCWHMDPHQLAWMDYMHEGPTKIWYAVAERDAAVFRRAMLMLVPAVVQHKGIWLASDTTMVPPSELIAHGVQLQRVEQNLGEYIVVFPGAYASSIATGLTISESIYFENTSFLARLDTTFLQMRVDCEPAMFSNTLLLMRMASDPAVSDTVLPRVLYLLKEMYKEEFDARREAQELKCNIIVDKGRGDTAQWPISWPYQEECTICRVPLILSKSTRYNESRSLMCLKHALRVYRCAPAEEKAQPPPVTLLYSAVELNGIVLALERRILSSLPNATD